MGEKSNVLWMAVFIVGVFLFAVIFSGLDLNLTGYSIFSDDDGGDFGSGVYNNVEWNGSAVVLSGDNLSGDYVSQVFDAGADSDWNSLTSVSVVPSVEILYAVDGAGDVYRSMDFGSNWVLMVDSYGRTTSTQGMFADENYLYIVVGGAREVWRSDDEGVTWVVVNDSFNKDLEEGEADLNDKLYVVGGDGTVWQSTDFGVSWTVKGDFNAGAINDAKGICVNSDNELYITDGSNGVFNSSDEGVTWTEITNDYGGGTPDDIACLGTNLYIFKDKELYESIDSGVSWTEINHAAIAGADLRMDSSGGVLYALDVKGNSYNSSDGVVWEEIGDMNPGDNDPKGMAFFGMLTNISFQVMNCSVSDCSDGSWQSVDLDSIDLSGQYFRYKVNFLSLVAGVSPSLSGVEVDYDLVDSDYPSVSFGSETTSEGSHKTDAINVDIDLSDASQIYSFINFDNSLAGFWKMNEISGDIIDYSGNGNDGSVTGASYGADGKFGDAMSFDGIGDYINFENINSFERTDNFSYSFWMNTDSSTNNLFIMAKTPWGVFHGMEAFISNGKLYMYLIGASEQIYARSTNVVTTGNWIHITITYDGSSLPSGIKIYLNGVEESVPSGGSLTTSIVNSNNFQISGRAGNHNCFDGLIDDFLVFDRALSTEEISALYDASDYSDNFTDLDVGSYDFYAYAQDIYGNEAQTSTRIVTLTSNAVPDLDLISPMSGLYTSGLIDLNYSVVDSDGDLDSCWYNVGGANISLTDCFNVTLDLNDGDYVLIIYANDSLGEVSEDSIGFSVDASGVSVVLSEPTGVKDSRTGIDIIYSASGADECWYNIETSIGGSVVGNTSLADCNDSSFDVSVDGDYVVNVFANNSFGSFGFDSSVFSVDTTEDTVVVVPSGGSGSISGGGSFGMPSPIVAKLEVGNISAIVSFGEEKSLVANVKNVGKVSANKCSLVSEGDYVDANDILNIGVGEIVEFNFILMASSGVSDLKLDVVCLDNVSAEVPLDVLVLIPDLDVSIEGISSNVDGELFIDYSVEPVDSSDRILYFRIINSFGGVVKEVSEEVSLVFGEVYNGNVSIDISDVSEGMLKISVGDEDANFIEEDFIYEGAGVTGFVALNLLRGNSPYVLVMLLVFLVLAVLIIVRIWKLKKK